MAAQACASTHLRAWEDDVRGVTQSYEIGAELVGRGVTMRRIASERSCHDGGKTAREIVVSAGLERRGVRRKLHPNEIGPVDVRAEDVSPQDRSRQKRSDRIEVGSGHDLSALQELLGRHVLERPDDDVADGDGGKLGHRRPPRLAENRLTPRSTIVARRRPRASAACKMTLPGLRSRCTTRAR